MEVLNNENSKIKEFLKLEFGSGSGSGYGSGRGSGYGSGSGSGDGDGDGYGDGSGSGYGYGDGYGDGYGSGYGYGDGFGSGDGDGYGDGSGSGYGYGDGISIFNHKNVYMIDDVATIITVIFGNYAKGYILREDLTLQPCYIVKGENCFAHGDTLADAVRDLNDKLFENMDEDERIAAFWGCHKKGVKYPAMDLYEWHHKLTGSCEAGRKNFAIAHGINLETDSYTVEEFVELCRHDYGGKIIAKL